MDPELLILNILSHAVKPTTLQVEYADNVNFALKGNLWLSIWLTTPPTVHRRVQDTGSSPDQTWHYTRGNYMLRL